VIFWVLYLLSLPLVWYENKYIVRPFLDRPPVFTPVNQSIFYGLRLLIAYGSLVGLWYFYNFWTALASLLIFGGFSKWTFRVYYRQQVRKQALFYRQELTRLEDQDPNSFEEYCLQLATEEVEKNMRTGGFG